MNNKERDPQLALQVEGISKRYDRSVALREVSLSLKKGEFLSLLGPSGSGKTTSLKIIAGFERPDTGSVRVRGSDITNEPPHRRNLGMVFQNYALFPHMSVARNIAFPLVMRKVPRKEIDKRVTEALELVNLGPYGERRPAQLSGGQQQRVAVARAMVFRPELLLMDEPLGALDKKLREHLQIEIMRLQDETGITIVYVTHDQEEALRMSDRIAIYRDGAIEQIGDAETLYEAPNSLFVADFMGESNIFKGRLHDGPRTTLRNEHTEIPVRVVGSRPVGQGAVVVRPERMRLREPGTPPISSDVVVLPGTVTSTLYLGNATKYVVTLAYGQEVTALARPGEPWAHFAVGHRVEVEWHVGDSVTVLERDNDTVGAAPPELASAATARANP